MTVAGLVLAAGEGRRLGRAKALVQVDGRRLVDRAVATLRDGGCQPVFVVSGAVGLEVPRATVVDNPGWRTGMGSSLRAGLSALSDHQASEPVQAVVVALVDQPGIGLDVVRRLLAAWDEGAGVAVASYQGRRRNPVLLGRTHWAEVAALAVGDVGARPFLAARQDQVRAVECSDIGDPFDIDLPEDLTAFESGTLTAFESGTRHREGEARRA